MTLKTSAIDMGQCGHFQQGLNNARKSAGEISLPAQDEHERRSGIEYREIFDDTGTAIIEEDTTVSMCNAEAALKEREEFLRNVFDNMLDSILIVDWDGTILFGNNAVAKLVGFDSPRQGIGRNLAEFIHPDSLEKAIRDLMLAREDKGGFLDEHKIVTVSGEQKIVEATGRRIMFGGKSADIIGLRDITARRKAEEALRESEELFRRLVGNMLDSLLIVDLSGNIIFANEAAVQMGEVGSIDDIVGKNIRSFLSKPDWKRALDYYYNMHMNFLYEFKITTGRGSEKFLEVLGNVIRFRGRDSVLLNLRDITERKKSEQTLLEAYASLQAEIREKEEAQRRLKEYQDRLEEKVTARTAELKKANKQLEAAYAEVKASEEMVIQQEKLASIGQLAAGIAHEIKNPLAIIIQGTEFIQSSMDDEFLADAAERVKNSANRADGIIKGLLSFSRQAAISLEPGDITAVLNESISLVGHSLTRRNIRVIREFSEVPALRFDANQLKQVFINLLMNSIESMDCGGPLKIELMKAPRGGREVLIRFTDNGCGIEKEIIKKIFDPFFTTKRKTGGTGLGLSVSKGIIERHRGRIVIESKVGTGTEVSLYLPYGDSRGD